MNNCDLYSNPKSKLTVIPYSLFFHSIDNVIVFLLRQNPQPELAFRILPTLLEYGINSGMLMRTQTMVARAVLPPGRPVSVGAGTLTPFELPPRV